MSEILAASKWVTSVLLAEPRLKPLVGARFFSDFAPDVDPTTPDTDNSPPPYPMVIFDIRKSKNVIGGGGAKIISTPGLNIKVVSEDGGFGDIQPISDILLEIFGNVSPTNVTVGTNTYTILGCVEDSQYEFADAPDGIRYNYLGANYQVIVQKN